MSVTAEDIARITADVWRDVLAQDVGATGTAQGGDLTGCIQITGAFRGAVVLVVPAAVAQSAAAAMFALEAGAVGADESRDAIGELTNMIGGHVKSMVAGPSFLALPAVVPGCDHCLDASRLQLLAEQAVAGPGGAFMVRVYEDIG
jgi:chemotaxis protein CheX